MANLSALEKQFGTVDHNGGTLYLTNQAVATNYGTDGSVNYIANAVDSVGNEYQVTWYTTEQYDLACEKATLEAEIESAKRYHEDITERAERLAELEEMNLPDASDETIACDWETPDEIKKI